MRIIKESDNPRVDFLRQKIGILQNRIDAGNASFKIWDGGVFDTFEGHLKRYSKELADLYDSLKNLDNLTEDYYNTDTNKDYSFEYRLLDRLRSDCDYYLGTGNRSDKYLWAGNVDNQIAKMKELWNKLPEKPEWLSMEDIEDYERRMKLKDPMKEQFRRIVANIYDKSGNIVETKHFSSRKQLDNYADSLNNLVDMTADNNILYKDSDGNIAIQNVWKITVDDLITEDAEKKKELGAFVKLNAGNVEEGNKFFNKVVGATESGDGCSMVEDLNKNINIESELLKLDDEDYRDLANMYDSIKYDLSVEDKKGLASLLANAEDTEKINKVEKFINYKYDKIMNMGNEDSIDLGTFYKKDTLIESVDDNFNSPSILSKQDKMRARLDKIAKEREALEAKLDKQVMLDYRSIDQKIFDKLEELELEENAIRNKLKED